MLEMCSGIFFAQNERVTATITGLQDTIKNSADSLSWIPITVQNHHQVMVIRKRIKTENSESRPAENLVDRKVTVE